MFLLNTTIDDSSPLISYGPVGEWNSYGTVSEVNITGYYKNSYTSTWTQNAFATIQFNGSSISIYGGRRKTYGNFTVTLDGVNSTLSSFSPSVQDPPDLLFSTQMRQGWHTVKVSNDGTTGIDIDSITWASEMANDSPFTDDNGSSSSPPPSITYDNSMAEFSWTPEDAWYENPDSANERITSSFGASMNFTFEILTKIVGQAISLSGPIGPNYTSSYSVVLDDLPPRYFSATRTPGTAVLYHADQLGPGNHTVTIINHGAGNVTVNNTNVRRQATFSDPQNCFGIHQAQVWKGASEAAITQITDQPGHNLSTGAIVGVSLGSIVLMALVVLILLLNRRNKTLWARLQKGYMVQSQFDPPSGAPTRSATPPMTSHWHSVSRNQVIAPYPPVEGDPILSQKSAGLTHHRDQTGSSLYQPYAGFGQSKHVALESEGYSSSGERNLDRIGSHRHRPEPLSLPIPGIDILPTPQRSETMLTTLTVSTLVAEDGREPFTDDLDTASNTKPFTKVGFLSPRSHTLALTTLKMASRWKPKPTVQRVAHNTTITTPNSYTAAPDLDFHQVLPMKTPQTPKSSSILLSGTRRSSRYSRSSGFSRQHRRQTRSSSRSKVHLLHPSPQSDFEDGPYDYDEAEDSADFYARDAQELVGRLRISTVSVQRLQSDAQTPIRGRREDDFDSDYTSVQFPSWLAGINNVSVPAMNSPTTIPANSDILDPDPRRKTSNDTLPPVYTSRAASVERPPPFLTP
ncbi:hypothetical protein GGU10DRAFT_405605 [Lentinula aff. detonsa]|uniref:Transmembrane protein n=1 Tax=Lentinula aff. detonsa TaxID=2804958 RepID=A0AA38NP53_9AGAR|nr:hypothetical protein GGU10DRAFT_405605 [Lentinula aff. detonsa]